MFGVELEVQKPDKREVWFPAEWSVPRGMASGSRRKWPVLTGNGPAISGEHR